MRAYNRKPSSAKAVIEALPKAPSLPAESPTPDNGDDKGPVKQTLYLPIGVHQQLRGLAYRENCSQQELFRQALNMLFKDRTLPLWDELKEAKP